MRRNGTAVIGLGFGDEGKGRVVDWLCRTHNVSRVVRFSGGQQAAHHVISGETDHIFASFGSGTLAGKPTYVMKHCTILPGAIFNEYQSLKEKGINPVMRIDNKCPVTTPYEMVYNIFDKKNRKHGTCNVGVGKTWAREENHYSLLAEDLKFTQIVREKLKLIRSYYQEIAVISSNEEEDVHVLEKAEETFMQEFSFLNNYPDNFLICDINHILMSQTVLESSIVFEGSQGLLLDPAIGFFPHVTRSTIGLSNLIKDGHEPDVFLVTRAYQTRHGNGPMTNEHLGHNIKPNPHEKNGDDGPQGKFRTSLLDIDLLKYAITKEPYLSTNREKLNLVITCMDLIEDEWRYTSGQNIICHLNRDSFVKCIAAELGINKVYISDSPEGDIERWI